jgi:hypothetical protein
MTEETQKIIEQVMNDKIKEIKEEYPDWEVPQDNDVYILSINQTKEVIEKALELQQEEFGKSDFRDKIFSLADILEIIDKLPANVLNDYKKDILKEKINNLK